MEDKTLIKICLAWSCIGILILIGFALFTEPKPVKISELNEKIGKTIIIQGEVLKASYKEKASFLDVADGSGNISVVLFAKPENKTIQGDVVQVKGIVKLYKGDLEIVADEVLCIRCRQLVLE